MNASSSSSSSNAAAADPFSLVGLVPKSHENFTQILASVTKTKPGAVFQ